MTESYAHTFNVTGCCVKIHPYFCPLDDGFVLLHVPAEYLGGGVRCGQTRHPHPQRQSAGLDRPWGSLRAIPRHIWEFSYKYWLWVKIENDITFFIMIYDDVCVLSLAAIDALMKVLKVEQKLRPFPKVLNLVACFLYICLSKQIVCCNAQVLMGTNFVWIFFSFDFKNVHMAVCVL